MKLEHASHCTYSCLYHVIFIPKYRKRKLFTGIRPWLIERFKELAAQKGCRIETGVGGIQIDHVHMVISIPPKLSVAGVVGYIKGKSAILIARDFTGKKRNFVGEHFWARGYFVSTVGADEETIKKYVENQNKADIKFDRMNGRLS